MNTASRSENIASGYAVGGVRWTLRGEAFVVFISSMAIFFVLGGNLWMFAILFFVPDLSFIAYAVNTRVGAVVYNVVHSYALAAVLAVAGMGLESEILWQVALILTAHSAFDRTLGYGLKYAAGFRQTHLGPIGKRG